MSKLVAVGRLGEKDGLRFHICWTSLMIKLIFEKKPEECKRVSLADIWGKSVPAEEIASTKALRGEKSDLL